MKKYNIIIPTYNSVSTIDRCLGSIVEQDSKLFDVIIVNDGSTDKTLDKLLEYQRNFSNIKVIDQENGGPSKARNTAINNSNGDFLVFVDDDDYISKDFFENIDSHVDGKDDMLKYNALYVGNRIPSDSFATDSFGPMNGEEALKYLIESKKIFATLWQYVFRRDLFTDNGLFLLDDNIHEDYGLVPTLILYSDSIKGINYTGYNYIYKEGSLSTNQNYEAVVKRAFDMLEQYDYLKRISDTRIKDPNVKAVFDKYITDSVLRKVKKLKDEELTRFERELTRRRII